MYDRVVSHHNRTGVLEVDPQLRCDLYRVVHERAFKIRSNANYIAPTEADHWIYPPSKVSRRYCL
jgi:hypothetical protein